MDQAWCEQVVNYLMELALAILGQLILQIKNNSLFVRVICCIHFAVKKMPNDFNKYKYIIKFKRI